MKNLLLHKIIHFFNLDTELEDPATVNEEIKKGIEFKGTNLWILIFAIVVASVGLNMNSTAVIIGAMLISPLMGPINGMGYSIAVYDRIMFKKAIKNFTFAVIAGLCASSFYFMLTPISTAHSELLARTSPTIYDVIIALFGGLAGIVAISSKQKGNVIPGVAIATALMPPLCTAGYGIATGQFDYFFGAIYLFTINTIFIAFAAVLISQILKFPIQGEINEERKKRINKMISVVITIVLLPSIYFGYRLIEEEKFTQMAKRYISNVNVFEGYYLLKSNVDSKAKKIVLIYGGNKIEENQIKLITEKAKDFDLADASIHIEQGLAFSGMDEKNLELNKLKEKLISTQAIIMDKNKIIDSLNLKANFGKVLLSEIKSIFPQIEGFYYSSGNYFSDTSKIGILYSTVLIESKPSLNKIEKEKIKDWLNNRLNSKKINVYFE